MNRINCLSIAATLVTLGLTAMAAEPSQLAVEPTGAGYVSTRVQLSQAQPAPGTVQPAPPAAGGMMGMDMMGRGMMGMSQGGMGQGGVGQGGVGQGGVGQGGMGRMMGMDMMEMGGGMGQGGMPQGQPGGQQGMQMGAPAPGQPMAGPGAMGMGRGPMAGPMAGRMSGPMAAQPIDRIEGRIAFLRAELKITEAQTTAWNEFAEVVRAGARRHNEMREHMMAARTGAGDMSARLEQHERMLNGRLESTRTIRASLGRLQAVLTEDQRRTLDELMPTL